MERLQSRSLTLDLALLPWIGVMLLAIHAVFGFVWLSFIALAAARARTIAWNSNVVRWLEGAVGAFFLAVAGRLVVEQR